MTNLGHSKGLSWTTKFPFDIYRGLVGLLAAVSASWMEGNVSLPLSRQQLLQVQSAF